MSGFGNIDDGVLVFGAATTTVASTKLEVLNALKGVSPLDQYEERVRIYVKTSTEPPVPGVIVQKIADPTQANHGIVIVYIPLTDMGPFRARGPKPDVADKYFMRTTSDTLVMPHQILAALFGRRPPRSCALVSSEGTKSTRSASTSRTLVGARQQARSSA